METLDADLSRLRQIAMESAERHAAFKRENGDRIYLADVDADVYFWPEQTDEQRTMMKEWLVDAGVATWAVKR